MFQGEGDNFRTEQDLRKEVFKKSMKYIKNIECHLHDIKSYSNNNRRNQGKAYTMWLMSTEDMFVRLQLITF